VDWRAEDLRILKNKHEWPLFPLLPVKKSVGGGHFPLAGVVFANDEKPVVYKGVSIFDLGVRSGGTVKGLVLHVDSKPSPHPDQQLRAILDRYEKLEFTTWEQFQQEGWMID
jgi:hypothetical protein